MVGINCVCGVFLKLNADPFLLSLLVIAHRFYKNHTDLGFPQIVKKNVLQNRKSGCLVRDRLQLEFVMQVIDTIAYPVEGTF